jgi:beta-xylosidase
MKTNHKAPFDRDGAVMQKSGAQALMKSQAAAREALAAGAAQTTVFQNVQVNQDRNPWPKAVVAAAIDPTEAGNWVVMTNDFRRNFNQMFFHVSTNNGATWTDDAMTGGSNPFTGFIPSTFQSDPGVSFDSSGNSYLSTITGNLLFDFISGYENLDTEIDEVQGFAHGTYGESASDSD